MPVLTRPRHAVLDRALVAQTNTIWLATFDEPTRAHDLVGEKNIVLPGGWNADDGGAATFNGTQAAALPYAIPSVAGVQRPLIIAARIKATGTQPGNPGAAFGLYSTGVQRGFGVGFDGANNVGAAWLNTNGAGLQAYSPGVQNRWFTVYVACSDVAPYLYAWVDGQPVKTNQGVAFGGASALLNEIVLGAQHRSAGYLRWFAGSIAWAAIMSPPDVDTVGLGVMTDASAAALYESGYPYNLFSRRRTSLWTAAPAGAAALAGDAAAGASGAANLTTAISVIASGVSVAAASGSLSTAVPLAGTSAAISTAAGSLTTTIRFEGAALSAAVAAAALAGGAAALTGSSAALAAAAGALDTNIGLGGAGAAESGASATVVTAIRLSGAAISAALAAAGLDTAPQGLAANAGAQSNGAGALTTMIPLMGAASVISISAAGLTTGIAVAGVAASVSGATGDLTVAITWSGTALSQALAHGSLSAQISLDGGAVSQALASASFAVTEYRKALRMTISAAHASARLSTARHTARCALES